ncbi:MAG: hypothetical protein QNL70_08620 [Pseudomonas sp.]|uniref:Uncharacterized protein n=1 Tax=Halopseudomonas litoralis TaxID=797277 RepID=A0A1H1QSJ3_9GAMM|nr:hypothetical protein [Halopseudomonas litoralis]SDS26283.1 hypothetical protein SAMN05216198_1563 [Halopseudomonas litoralis]
MAPRFARLMQRMHAVGADRLSDSQGDYLDRNGAVLATELALIIDKDVDRVDMVSGAVDRGITVAVLHGLIQPLDRKGAFVVDGKTLHIDGIAEDDGHLITFYVVP